MNWKTIFIIGLGILSITVLYYCYKRYYNEEGFQVTQANIISSDTFVGSSVRAREYKFDGSIVSLRQMYTEIINFVTDYHNFSGYANAPKYYYYSNKYKKNLTIVDFSYSNSPTTGTKYWFPFTGQYGASPNWLSNFRDETTAILDIDVYNNNLSNYISFVNTYSGNNKQKFIFNRPLTRPSLLYRGFDLTQPPSDYNILSNDGTILDINITQVADFNESRQSWWRNFAGTDGYARTGKNLYPPSDDPRDTLYRVLYGNPKPPNLTYSNVNNGKKAGQIVNLIPDRRSDLQYASSEQLLLNVYGGQITLEQSNAFKESMFLGSVFTNFDDQYNLDTILRVPYDGLTNGSNCSYSFNMFLPELTPNVVITGGNPTFNYIVNTENIRYNNNLVNSRNYTNNTIKTISDTEYSYNKDDFISFIKSAGFTGRTRVAITNSNQAYVGQITPQMMAKIPNLARRYITSWVYNRSTRYLGMHLEDLSGSSGINANELKKAQYICLAMRNFSGEYLTRFLNTYAAHAPFTTGTGPFTEDGTMSNVPSEEAARRIVASSRIYNSYSYSGTTLSLSITGGNLNKFNKGSTSNYFRNPDASHNISQFILSALLQLNNSISQELLSFPTDGATNALENVNAANLDLTTDINIVSFGTAATSTQYVKSILQNIISLLGSLNNYLTNTNTYEQAVSLISNLINMVGYHNLFSLPSNQNIQSIVYNSATNDITITLNTTSGYSANNYISISGTTNYNGDFFKIKSVVGNTLIVDYNLATGQSTAGGIISICSLYTFLKDSQSKINASLAVITSSSSAIQENNNIIKAKKNLEINKAFVDSFVSNFSQIKNTIICIVEGVSIINNIYQLLKTPPVGTDQSVKDSIARAITDVSGTIIDSARFLTAITLIKTNSTNNDSEYAEYLRIRDLANTASIEYRIAQENINKYITTLPQYNQAITLLANATTNRNTLTNLQTSLTNLQRTIGTGTVAGAMAVPTDIEIQTLESDFNNLIYNNKLLPDYGDLSNLNISDEGFLNSIAQLYYESSDGLYEMTTIYDVYMVGSNSIDIRFDKKQRLPNGKINNLEIQYLPQIQEYNRLLDIMNDGSWSNYYSDKTYTKNGQTLTMNAIDFYYDDLSAVSNKLEPIFNPVYPIDQNINVKDLQIQLSNLNSSNDIITNILNGKLTGSKAPYIGETQDTLGMNYTDRLATIQNNLYNQMNTIQTQISGILQGCARVFVRPTYNNKWSFPINGMAIGVNAALTYNLAYNGNLEIDMGNMQGNIGQYYPTIVYTKNLTPPIICGDIKFINKATALFNQTAFLNLSSMTTQITGDDNDKRLSSEPNDVYTANIIARQNNFYNSNDGPLYVNKILGFQQINSNTCYYKWQETQYDPLTNGVFTTSAGVRKQRTVNVQYQFLYDNTEYQNPKLLPDNNPNGVRVGQGFKYLADNTYVPFGDLYQSLYTWYASATRDLFSYLNDISNQYTRLHTPEYTNLMGLYNTNTSNISTLNISTAMLFSTNLAITNTFKQMLPTLSITTIGTGTCDSILNKPPTFTTNYEGLRYNFRPGDGYGLTTYSGVTYNKYRTLDIGYFMNNMLLTNPATARPIPTCDPLEAISNPENCFTAEIDKCVYNLGTNSGPYRDIIMRNLEKRTLIQNAINATNTAITTTTNNINIQLRTQTTSYLTTNIIYSAGQTLEELYPQVSNINNQITSLSNQSNATITSIDNITRQYNTILTTQNSDINLPTYMNNQVIPIIKPLPDESPSLDNQYGQCPPYLCTSPVVMNTLIEQYNLDNDYDDTITRVLKGATANSYQCDYLVEVRKKNAIVINNSLQFNRIRFTPLQVSYNDNRDGIYFNGSNSYIALQSSDACFRLGSNNFTIDWFQYSLFDSDNTTSTVFVVGDYRLGVTFEQRSNNILRFNLYINNFIKKYVDFNYNAFNRWTYLAIVRYNNVITCYKDGFAFLSLQQLDDITGDLTNIYIGNDRLRERGKYFKGCIRNFAFNNYDALYKEDIFNTVPTNPVKNINTKFILQISANGSINNIINRNIYYLNVNNNGIAPSQITTQTFLTNGTILKEIFRGNNQNNGVAVSDANVIYVADTLNHVIKQLNTDGTFSIIAGTLGVQGSLGMTGLATSAYLNSPSGLVYGNNTLFIADTGNNRICYKEDNNINELVTGVTNVKYITYYSGYIYYVFNNNIYRIHINTRIIDTIVSSGLNNPSGICIDSSGILYVADSVNHRICKITGSTITRIVGTGIPTTYTTVNPIQPTNLGDGGSPLAATLKNPTSVTVDLIGNIYIGDTGNNRIRMVTYFNSQYTSITTIAGDGTPSSSYNEGYGRFIPIIPQYVFYKNDTLYVVDSRRICSVKKATIPSAPTSWVYNFIPGTSLKYISIGNLGESDYKFNKNIFTIQWFMYMQGSSNQTIFTFENGNTIQLGVTFQGTNMNIWINGTSYIIGFITNEIQSLWVHLGLVNNGSTLSLYKNGILIYSIDSTNISFNTVDTQLTIGNRNTKIASNNFNGYIYNFIIYNKIAINYNNSIVAYNSVSLCSPNLVLYLADGTQSFNDSSVSNPEIYQNFVSYIDSFPYNNTYNPFKINLRYNNNTQQEFIFNTVNTYGTILPVVSLGTLKNITSFKIYSLQDTKAVQQWFLEGSSNGTDWITLDQQLEPYRSISPIYPKVNTYSPDIPIQVQQNTGGDYLTMTKSFKVARLIADCSIVITSNVDDQDNYTKGVTSSNGFFIQENTPYVVDSSGTDVSGFQFIGNLLNDYESNVKSLYDPIVTNAETISGKMSDAYQKSLSDTYSAIGKLNTLNFYSINNYDSLRTYMLNNTRFRNSIFDSYPYSDAYMSNIIRFNIADSNNIDIIFNKVDLSASATSISYGTTTTAGARYRLSVSQGFLDLTASFLSNVTPTANILNDDYTNLINPRGKDYKDRLNQTSKLVSGIRTPIPDTSILQSTLPIDLTTIESLTGLTGITSSNVIDATKNKIEYMITTDGTSPIGKTNYIVQYVSPTEMNSVISATIDNTKFKTSITAANLSTYINNFKVYFNDLYSITRGYPFNSILKKVYGYSIVNDILYLSVGIEYTYDKKNYDNTITESIYYNMMPNISEFATQVYYKVIFTGNTVLAFEPCVSTAGGTLTSYTDTTALIQSGATPNEIKNNYKNNLLWKQIKFIPSSSSSTSTYSISQIQFFNSALLSDEATKPRVIQSLSINGGNTNNFDLTNLIDGVNINLRSIENISGRYFTHTYVGGEITATFKEPTSANGFSFMTAYSLQNPQKWVVQGTTDGTTWIDLVRQDINYLDVVVPNTYISFYRTPIFSFSGAQNIVLNPSPIQRTDALATTDYNFLRITPISASFNYQLTQISLYNGQTLQTPSTTTPDPTLSTRTLSYLFDNRNISQTNPTSVTTLDAPINTPLLIQFTSVIKFNGISFVTGIDVNKCMTRWTIEASPDNINWNTIHIQQFPYTNDSINYPHFFCRTPIFYSTGQIVETLQPQLYETKSWPIRYVRFKPIYMYGAGRGGTFEVSHIDFFNDATPLSLSSINTNSNSNLLTPIITCRNRDPPCSATTVATTANDLQVFVGNYFDPSKNSIDFVFNSAQSFNGFSFMSGSQANNCVQLWTLEVSIDGSFWVIVHSTNNIPFTNNYYPSPYYRLPIIYFDKNINIESTTKYYIISGTPDLITNTTTPTNPSNNGMLIEIKILFTIINQYIVTSFVSTDYNNLYFGKLYNSKTQSSGYFLKWNNFLTAPISSSTNPVYYKNVYPDTTTGTTTQSMSLYSIGGTTSNLVIGMLDKSPTVTPAINGVNTRPPGTNITRFNIYINTTTNTGAVFNTNSSIYLNQLDSWTPSANQGFTNYAKIHYIERLLLQTNKSFDIKLFRLIGSNNKVLPKMFYSVESQNKNFIIHLKAYVEIIGYTITTGLYSQVSDPDSWKLFGMKNGSYVLLDKQDNYDIPVDRSTTLPPFYFGSKPTVRNMIKDTKSDTPNMEIIELYYKQKINPFGKAVFKQYMYDNDKTYYMVFDEYDNNRNLIGEDLIIGFVIVKGKVKKPIMYENPDGSFDAFNLKKKEMMTFWKKKILIHGLKLETKYLSDY